jgi:hypothetical protein
MLSSVTSGRLVSETMREITRFAVEPAGPATVYDAPENTLRPRHIAILAAIILFSAAVRIPSLTQPLGPDQGIMSVIGKGILEGKLPYRDFWEMGSPAIFFTYALMFKLFGLRMATVPLTDLLVSMVTTFMIFVVARRIWNRNVGFVSALLFAFFSNGVRFGMHSGGDIAFGTFWYVAQRETFMLPLFTAGFYLLLRSDKGAHPSIWLWFAGFTSGLAVVYKFPGLVVFLCLPVYLNASFKSNGIRLFSHESLKRNFALGSGFVLAFVPFVLFFWFKHVLPEMVDVVFGYVSSVYARADTDYLGMIKIGLTRARFIAEENFILWIFFLVSSLNIFAAERRRETLLIVGWGCAALMFLVSHREFFGYHFLMLLPPFCILSGYGLVKSLGPKLTLRRIFSAEFEKAFILLAVAANLAFFTTLNFLHYTKFYYYVTGKSSREAYYSYFNSYPKHDFSFPADYAVARYIEEKTKATDCIFTMGGTDAVIEFLSNRRSASRFIFSWVLFQGRHAEVDRAERYRQELLADLRTNQPRYIVSIGPLEKFRQFVDLYNFVNGHYILEKEFPDGRFVYGWRQIQG